MDSIAFYLFKSSVWTAAFAAVYLLFLRNEHYFKLNRLFLLTGIAASMLFPLFTFRYAVPLPVAPSVATGALQVQGVAENGNAYLWYNLLVVLVYCTGIVISLWRILSQSLQMARLIYRTGVNHIGEAKVVKSAGYASSFSFFSFVIVNPSITDIEANEIIRHEQQHIRQHHWFDLLLVELLCIVQWFNPVAWLYGRFVRQNHEFLADESALQSSSNPAVYRAALLNQMFGGPVVSLANSFNYSLNKKRFKMMKKTVVSPIRKAKLILILPVVATLFWAFATPEYSVSKTVSLQAAAPAGGALVKGRVVAQSGEGIRGASIVLGGTTTGTLSGSDGLFQLADVPSDGQISVSFVGYKTVSVKPDFASAMNIVLQKDTVVIKNGITVVGYESKPNPEKPVADADIRLRGNGPEPIFIQNGKMITREEMEKIDKYAIESIHVWKGEEAVSRHGEKGKNGVVEITMKSAAKAATPVNAPQDKPKNSSDKPVFMVVEQMPEYPGGQEALMQFLAQNIKYPAEAAKEKATGKVFVSFVITETGKVSDVKVQRSVHSLLDAEAVRVVGTMPDWKPGKQRGQNVAVSYTIPIDFKLQ